MRVYTCVHILHVNVYHVWLQCVFAILPTFIDYMGFVCIMYMYVCMYIDILYRARSSLSGLMFYKSYLLLLLLSLPVCKVLRATWVGAIHVSVVMIITQLSHWWLPKCRKGNSQAETL